MLGSITSLCDWTPHVLARGSKYGHIKYLEVLHEERCNTHLAICASTVHVLYGYAVQTSRNPERAWLLPSSNSARWLRFRTSMRFGTMGVDRQPATILRKQMPPSE